MFIESYSINIKSSRREEFIQITDSINDLIRVANATEGFVKIFVPHTTAAITITQGENPDVVTDIMSMLDDLKPKKDFLNVQGNSDAHLKSAFLGVSLEIPFDHKKLALGEWQGIFFCEFDGPRTRKVKIQIWAL